MGKPLGQHFLENRRSLRRIAAALQLEPHDTVIEVGGGHGELTRVLRITNKELRIIAIEKDAALASELKGRMGDEKTEIIEGDVLKVLPLMIHNSPFTIQSYKLVGNIPYYLTGRLLRTIGELPEKPSHVVLTVQREVAERIAARPPRMNLLAASVQFWAAPHIVALVPAREFTPPPKVDSAILELVPRATPPDPERYYRAVRVLFKQPRKTILNNLAAGSPRTARGEIAGKLASAGVRPEGRPQDLSVEDILAIASLRYT